MGKKLTRRQLELVRHLDTYRVLSARQVAVLQGVGLQAACKRLRQLGTLGLVESRSRGYGRARGRPARIHSLSQKGMVHLKDLAPQDCQGTQDRHTPDELMAVDHRILLNWCLLHLAHLEKILPQLELHLVFRPRPLADSVQVVAPRRSGRGKRSSTDATFPDAAFAITSDEQGKTLLFFLEVDMATETMAGPTRTDGDFRSKVLRYQALFRTAGYKTYETTWNCPLRGFRLLVVANSQTRLASLCRLVRQMPPSDFVWLTDQVSLFAEGITAPIWARGGHLDSPPQSIVGPQFSRAAPLLPSGCQSSYLVARLH